MGKLLWVLPLVVALGGCSKSPQTSTPAAANSTVTARGNLEPVAPVASQPLGSPAAAPAQAAPQPVPGPPSQADLPAPAPEEAAVVIPRGAHLRVRIDQEVDTRHNHAGDRFSATLYQPLESDRGVILLPVGTRFRGHLTAARPSHRLHGRAVLGLTLDSFLYRGREIRIDTSSAYRESGRHKKRNIGFIAGGGGFGAALGAIAGGGAGAAIGALAGGGAGLAGAVITGKKQVAVSAEAPLVFTLHERIRI